MTDTQAFLPDLADAYSYLYAALRPDTHEVKIGIAHDPIERIGVLQTGSAVKLLLVLVIPCAYGDERAVHARWDHLRLNGEWFRATEEVLEWIAAQQTVASALPRRAAWFHAPATCTEMAGDRPCKARAASRVHVGDECRPVCHIHLPRAIANLGETPHRVERRPPVDPRSPAKYRQAVRASPR